VARAMAAALSSKHLFHAIPRCLTPCRCGHRCPRGAASRTQRQVEGSLIDELRPSRPTAHPLAVAAGSGTVSCHASGRSRLAL
jgi:hypothetical protein